MNRGRLLALGALLLGAWFAPMARAVEFYLWTGIGNGWKGQADPFAAMAIDPALVFDDAVRPQVPVPTYIVNSLHFLGDEDFEFFGAGEGTAILSIVAGVDAAEAEFMRADFADDITLDIVQNQTWNLGESGTVSLHGPLTGSGNLTVTGTGQPALILANESGSPANYSGTLTLEPAAGSPLGFMPVLSIWGANSIGTGAIHFRNGGMLVTHLAPTLANNFVLNGGPLIGTQAAAAPLRFRMWDGPTTLTGSVTLEKATTLQPVTGWLNKLDSKQPNSVGAIPLPGPLTRHPLVINGAITESLVGSTLHVIGPGVVILGGANTYTGGTYVGFPADNPSGFNGGGSLVFASPSAIPGTGPVVAGQLNVNNATGYIGLGASSLAPGVLTNFLSRIALASSGAVGLDTLPGESEAVVSDNINLSGFDTTATNGIRLGTATKVTLTGDIFPQDLFVYHFGNGGGRLTVASPLDNIDGVNSLVLSNNGVPLELHLTGNNTYTGGTRVANGILVFQTDVSLPDAVSPNYRADGNAALVGNSYIGIGAGVEQPVSGFLADFDKANTWGTIGFDGKTVSDVDLTGFNKGVYLGTASTATLSGTLTPADVGSIETNPNPGNTHRFTAAAGGTLTVQSTLADGGQPVSVVIGVPVNPNMTKMSDGTVVLSGANTYTGGTLIQGQGGITVAVGNSSALGTGLVTVGSGLAGLQATAGGVVLGNDFVFGTSGGQSGTGTLSFTGGYNFGLSGDISGPDWSSTNGFGRVQLATPVWLTLSGDNTGFHGFFEVSRGALKFESNLAAGRGALVFTGPEGTAWFNQSGAAPAPVLYGIEGDSGSVVLGDGTNLTINLDHPAADYDFGGVIGGDDGTVAAASLTVTGTLSSDETEFLYLYGDNKFSGGVTITGTAALALGHANAAGSGPITIDTTEGGLALNTNVTLTNPLTLTEGGLAGLGTFAPTSFNGVVGGPIVIGAGNVVLPGVPGEPFIVGTLTFGGNTVFADGGAMQWVLSDPTDPDAFSLLKITGTLDLNGLSAGGFAFEAETINADGDEGTSSAAIVMGQSYSLKVISTTGGVLGFDAADFALNVSNFQQGSIPLEQFSLTADSHNIYLNFTAVPEPSTWALMVLGAGFVAVTAWRRRRA